MENDGRLHLTDLIEADVLQKIQNAFSDMTGMAALTTDAKGIPVTVGSNFTDFCFKYTRPTELGRRRCERCDMHGAELTLANGGSCSYYCHAGLVDFAAPIMANGEMVGSFIGGQVLTEPPDLDRVRATAEELGIDPELYVEAVKKIRIVSKETVEKTSHFLYVVATVLSNIAYKSYALHKSNLEIERASHMKSDFLANMSHEIRTPMNAVLGLSDLALREDMSAAARNYVHQIKASSKNLLVIINDILDFSKIESGKMDIVETEYEPMSIINDLTSIVNSRIGDKDIEFTMDIAPDLPKSLYGDSVRIHQIILNLLTNAVKFTHHGEVHLKVYFIKKDEKTVIMKVEIRDTGIGIKQQDMKKLFNSFQQLDSKRNRNIEGTGLGLAISKQLLSIMGGDIFVESEYNKGTTFMFDIPQKIIDPTPMVPKLEKPVKAAVLVGSDYVKNQLIRDFCWIGAEFIDLTDSAVEDVHIDYLIVEKPFFNRTIQKILFDNPHIQCLVITDYDSMDAIDMPNVHVISKPVYSLTLYNAMGIHEINFGGGYKSEGFTFVAPEAHILVVDDNAVNLTVAKGLLEPLNMNVDLAESAADAIEKIHNIKYDLIFMDHMMPEVDGVEATHIIRQLVPSYNDVPIIALTANAIGGAKEMFIREGMNDFVAKPIDIKDVTSKLRKWLPKEKILPIDKSDASRGSVQDLPYLGRDNSADVHTHGTENAHDILNINGLDVKDALALLGSEKLYMTVLKEYFCAIDKKYQTILDHKEAERWREYTIEVHSLKSTSKQIGANYVSTLAAEMEKAGNDGNIDLIKEKTGEMLEEYLKLKELLDPYFREESCPEDCVQEESESIITLLEQMQVALDCFDTLQIDEAVEKLSKLNFEGEDAKLFERLKKAAVNSDIDGCMSIVDEWGAALIKAQSAEGKTEALLDNLQSALDAFDTLEIDAVVEKMSKLNYDGEQQELFNRLREAAENSDIDRCGEIAAKWRSSIS